MPTYQYFDEEKRRIVEFQRPVAERDLVPAGLKRITVPERISIAGSSMDEHSAPYQVPKAFKQLEQKVPAAEIVREGGFSIDRIKQIWNM
jgi:hypothetical protein